MSLVALTVGTVMKLPHSHTWSDKSQRDIQAADWQGEWKLIVSPNGEVMQNRNTVYVWRLEQRLVYIELLIGQ